VTTASTSSTSVVRSSSRNTTPQPLGGCRFVPVSASTYPEVHRGRESSAMRGGSPTPGSTAEIPTASARALSPPHVAVVAAAAAGASSTARNALQPAMRQLGGSASGACTPVTPQPSRYAYVNSTARREYQNTQPNQREVRRRGRV
jgi:hypothetical protein